MKMFFKQGFSTSETIGEEYTSLDLKNSIQKTRLALDIAYAGFDNAVETELIDSYIYEIISLQKRYHYLVNLVEEEPIPEPEPLDQHSPIRALVGHVFG